jgi:polyferredoxin
MEERINDTEEYRDHISTVDERGKRIWIYPKKPSGKFYKWRTWASWILLAFLFGMPFVKIDGEPALMFNILERHFYIFGLHFAPQDLHLFVLAMLTLIVFIVLFTVVFGRLFCGWVCPQTIFMEMVFRKIEYWIEGDANQQKKLNAAPWTSDKFIKKISKQVIFFLIAVLVANTFLAYIIGVDEVIKIATEPVALHTGGFIAMLVFSFAFFFVFSQMREQVCTTICPYGRLQGVLLVEESIVVAYDYVRGEPRGKANKTKNEFRKSDPVSKIQDLVSGASGGAQMLSDLELDEESPIKIVGDCVACNLCVHVCPTGIDIRNGTQLECVNCTACIDACDEVMEKVGLPKGLIRYDSMKGIKSGVRNLINPRSIAYSIVLLVLLIFQVFLFSSRTDVEALIFRTPGTLFQKVDETTLSNMYNYQVTNKTKEEMPIEFRLLNEGGNLKMIGQDLVAKPDVAEQGVLIIEMKKENLDSRKTNLQIEVWTGDKLLDKIETNFYGPVK